VVGLAAAVLAACAGPSALPPLPTAIRPTETSESQVSVLGITPTATGLPGPVTLPAEVPQGATLSASGSITETETEAAGPMACQIQRNSCAFSHLVGDLDPNLLYSEGETPPYGDNDADLFAALADFEATYSHYAEFQDRMEHYWCLRWLLQEGVTEATARVIRENLVRFEQLPLVMRVADLPPQPADTMVRIAIGRVDLLAATFECRFAGRLEDVAVVE